MNARKTHDLPGPLEGLRRRFEKWRRGRKAPARIPESLWSAAVKMADTYGLCRTARALAVEYYALKKRLGQQSAAVGGMREVGALAAFVELPHPESANACTCTLELEDTAGSKMRVHLKAATPPDLTALCRSFWNPVS